MGLTSLSGRTLGNILKQLPSLRNLQIGRNDIKGAGMEAILQCLQHASHLRTIRLEKCSLGDIAMRRIVMVISKLKHLKELNVRMNPLISKKECEQAIKEIGYHVYTDYDHAIKIYR